MIKERDLFELISIPFELEGKAPQFIRISSAHISGVSYNNIKDEGLQFIEDLSNSGFKVKVPTTMNPGFCEVFNNDSDEIVKKQKQIVESFIRLGIKPTLSCIPYLYDNIPKKGEHVAWAESNAVLYVNSVIGSWSNKESGLTALASALLGVTAYSGVHLPENRIPRIRIKFNFSMKDEVDAGLAGYVLGKVVKDNVPLVKNCFSQKYSLIEFLASVGTSGIIPIIVIENLTPIDMNFDNIKNLEELTINEEDLERARKEIESTKGDEEAILIGCPHLSFEEIELLFKSSRLPEKETFIFVPRTIKGKIESKYAEMLSKKKNIKIVGDSCILWYGLLKRGFKRVATNSVKGAFYIRNVLNLDVKIKRTREIFGEEK